MMGPRQRLVAKYLILFGCIAAFAWIGTNSQEVYNVQETTAVVRTDQVRVDRPRADVSAKSTTQPSDGSPPWRIPLASLSDTRERPIFSPSRRPPPVVNAPTRLSQPLAIASPSRPPLSLVGAIAGDEDGIAILLDETTRAVIRLKIGESHAGWALRRVEGREAQLEKDRQITVLTLPNPPGE
jgi:hypothetical protein